MATTSVRTAHIDGLRIVYDDRVLEPRPWTAAQGHLLAEIAAAERVPPGPILELCSGAGHIGLVAARATGRDLVQVDRDGVAIGYAAANAAAAGVRTDLRERALADALAPEEFFDLALADPPWLRTDELGAFPDDPVGAVDGGPDGEVAIRAVLDTLTAHLTPRGHAVVQVGRRPQVAAVADHLERQRRGWTVAAVHDHLPGGLLVHVRRS